MTEFQQDVTTALKKVKKGKTVSYQELAKLAGHEKAYRAVATFCKKNWDTDIPCHRVVHSDGRVGKYNREGGTDEKIAKLEVEGVEIKNGYVIDKKSD